jgi:hypothetical protein
VVVPTVEPRWSLSLIGVYFPAIRADKRKRRRRACTRCRSANSGAKAFPSAQQAPEAYRHFDQRGQGTGQDWTEVLRNLRWIRQRHRRLTTYFREAVSGTRIRLGSSDESNFIEEDTNESSVENRERRCSVCRICDLGRQKDFGTETKFPNGKRKALRDCRGWIRGHRGGAEAGATAAYGRTRRS